MRELVQVVPVGPEVRLGVNRVRRRLVRRGPLATMANEMQEVLGEHATTANLLVAEERIRGHLARGGLAAASPDEAASNGKATPKGGRKAAKASHSNGAESQPKSAR